MKHIIPGNTQAEIKSGFFDYKIDLLSLATVQYSNDCLTNNADRISQQTLIIFFLKKSIATFLIPTKPMRYVIFPVD